MRHVRAGHDNRTIARLLQVQPSTVRKHLENTYDNLGVHSRTAALAVVFGAVDDDGPAQEAVPSGPVLTTG